MGRRKMGSSSASAGSTRSSRGASISLSICARERSRWITAVTGSNGTEAWMLRKLRRARLKSEAADPIWRGLLLSGLAGEIEARALARAADVQRAVAVGRARPALAVEHVGARELAVGLRIGSDEHDLARVRERDERVPYQDAVSRAEALDR